MQQAAIVLAGVLSLVMLAGRHTPCDAPVPTSDTPVPPAAKADDAPGAHHKLLYAVARARAAGQLAKKEGISRAAAREKIDEIDDATLHAAVQASGTAIKAMPVGGKLTDFLDWLAAHQDAIMAIVKIILALFA